MGKASVSIAITSSFDASGIVKAQERMTKLAAAAVSKNGEIGKSFVDAGNYCTDLGSSIGAVGDKMTALGKTISSVGSALTSTFTAPLVSVGTAAATTAIEIDTAFYNVRKTVDMTEEEYQKLKAAAIELSTTQPVDAATILNIEAMGGQLGIANDRLEEFAKTVSGLDIATNLDADTAATDLARFKNIVQYSDDEMGNFASTLVDLGNKSATTESEIMDMAMRFASAGSQAGMTSADIMGISAALSSLGMRSEAGGSALSKVINQINTDVASSSDAMADWAELCGMSVEDFTKAWEQDAAGTFTEILAGIGNASESMQVKLDELGISEIRTSDAMRRLAGNSDLVSSSVEIANKAWAENTALTTEVNNRNESMQARIDTLKNRLDAVASTIGGDLVNRLIELGEKLIEDAEIMGGQVGNALSAMVDGIEPVIDFIIKLIEGFNNLAPSTQSFITTAIGMVAALSPVVTVIGKVVSGAGSLVTGFGKVTSSLGSTSREWGIYEEAMTTTNDVLIRELANTDSLIAKKGLEKNALIQAAGGIDKYIEGSNNAITAMKEEEERTAFLEQAQQKIVAINEKVALSEDKIREIRAGVTGESPQVIAAEEGVEAAKKSHREATELLAMASDEYAAKQAELAAAEGAVQDAQVGAKTAADNLKAARAALKASSSEVTAATKLETQASNDAYKAMAQLENATTNVDTATKKVDTSVSEATAAMDIYTDATEKNKRLQAELVAAEKEYKAAQAEVKAAVEAKTSAQKAANEASKTQKAMSSELVAAEKNIVKAENEVEKAKNSAVKASDKATAAIEKEAAKVERLKKAQDSVVKSTENYMTASEKAAKLAETNAKKQQKANDAIAEYQEGLGTATKQTSAFTTTFKNMTTSIKSLGTSFVGSVKSMFTSFVSSLPTMAITAALGLITTAIASAIDSYNKAKEAAATYEKATTTLSNTIRSGVSAYSSYAQSVVTAQGALVDAVVAIEDIKAANEDFIASQAELADSYAAQNQEAAIQIATLQNALSVIEEYGGKTDLTTAQVGLLESAINTVNSELGTNYSRLSDNTVAYEENGEKIAINTQALKDNIDARIYAIQAEALTQQLADQNTKLQEANTILGDAQIAYNAAVEKLNNYAAELGYTQDANGNWITSSGELVTALDKQNSGFIDAKNAVTEAGKVLNDAKTDYEGVEKNVNDLSYQLGNLTKAQDENVTGIEKIIASNQSLQKALDFSDTKTQNFIKVLDDAGVTQEDFAALSDTSAYILAKSYDGSTQSVIKSLQDMGTEGATILSKLEAKNAESGAKAGENYATSLESQQGAVSNAANTIFKSAEAPLTDLRNKCQTWGNHSINNYADGIASGYARLRAVATDAALIVSSVWEHTTPKTGPLKHDDIWGLHMAQNFADGMQAGIPEIKQASFDMADAAALMSNSYGYGGITTAATTALGAQTVSVARGGDTNTVYNLYVNGEMLSSTDTGVQAAISTLASAITQQVNMRR